MLDMVRTKWTLFKNQAATNRGGLFGLSTGTNEAQNYVDLGLYYNLAWVEKLKVEDPAKMFNEGRWTYSEFEKWANGVQALLGEGQYAIGGRYYYHWVGLTNAAGIKIADPAAIKVTLKHAREVAAAELLSRLYVSGALGSGAAFDTWMETQGAFFDVKCVMTSGAWWFMKGDNRWTADMWGDDTRFGYVPFPRPDDMTKEQQQIAQYGTTVLMFAEGREKYHPAGVTYDDIYMAMLDFTKSNKARTIMALTKSIVKWVVVIINILLVLSAFGVDTSTLLASAGILALVIGLGAQSLIADIIAGFFIVFEAEYEVGDIITVDGFRGTVSDIGIDA